MMRTKEIEQSYINLLKNNYNLLISEGISQEKVDSIINTPGRKYPNMDDKVIEMLFVIETLKVFNKYDLSTPNIKQITRFGGGYYYDGDIFGYLVKLNNEKIYTIVLSNNVTTQGEALIFGATKDTEQLQKEQNMLRQFIGFSNSNTLYRQMNFLNIDRNLKKCNFKIQLRKRLQK